MRIALMIWICLWAVSIGAQKVDVDEFDKINWATTVEFPIEELAETIFNGRNLREWKGLDGYWRVWDGMLIGANDKPLKNSTYLFSRGEYRDFRLLFEVKQLRDKGYSRMHSGLAILGERYTDIDDPFGYRGPVLLFGGDWGVWDAHRRNRVFPEKHRGRWLHGAERFGKWNRIEVLVTNNRIRMVNNGKLVVDFKDRPSMLKPCSIGLQLHKNELKQEFHFRGFVISRDPLDRLLTLEPDEQPGIAKEQSRVPE